MDRRAVVVRNARSEDAAACAAVMRNSIRELCAADHGNRDDVLAGWLANKTPDVVAGWILNENTIFVIAEIEGEIAGVGSATRSGEITLNYVDPGARFKGVSTAMLAALEDRLSALVLNRVHLTSTNTALAFYRARGYVPDGPPKAWAGDTEVHPLVKALAPPAHKSGSARR